MTDFASDTKPRYRSPTTYATAEVSLGDFTIEDMRRELVHRAGNVDDDASGLPPTSNRSSEDFCHELAHAWKWGYDGKTP